ncbi:uncharacterized protein [Cicer arietinum]|uniref:uncharacterized protein n=1 Tax=Cicer arietinum TaxID=3827 RepID=UPI003CC5E025
MDMQSYIGKLDSLIVDFDALMPYTESAETHTEQHGKFFMVMALAGLTPDLDSVRNQILSSATIPSHETVCEQLLRLSPPSTPAPPVASPNVGGGRGHNRGRTRCNYCNRFGHIEAQCRTKDNQLQPGVANVAQIEALDTSDQVTLSTTEYNEYIKLKAQMQTTTQVASVAQIGNPIAFVTQSSSLGPWILDSGASDHMSGSKLIGVLGRRLEYGMSLKTYITFRHLQRLLHVPSSSLHILSINVWVMASSIKLCVLIPLNNNGVAERKNRHLVETARTMLLHNNVPPRFLGDAILIACYLINRMPSSVLENKKGYWCYSQIFDDTLSLPMSVSLRLAPSFSLLQKSSMILISHNLSLEVLNLPIAPTLVSIPTPVSSTTLHTYQWRPRPPPAPQDSSPALPDSHSLHPTPELPIALRKGNKSSRNPNPIYACHLNYNQLSTSYYAFVASLDSVSIPKTTGEAMSDPGWRQAMIDEMTDLHSNGTWDLVHLPDGKTIVGCRWSKTGIAITQGKYALDILEETGMLYCRPCDTLMDPNVKLLPGQGEPLQDPGRYRRLVGKLNYLTVARPDITFVVSVVSQFLNAPCDSHWNGVIHILRYIKNAPSKGLLYEDNGNTNVVGYSDADWAGSRSDRRSTSGYCVLVGGNLISWRSKKQNIVARSSAEAKYCVVAATACELTWLKQLLKQLKLGDVNVMKLICDNQVALHIASNPVFHERTKHIEIDFHFVRDKVLSGEITTNFVGSNDQLADIFTKSLRGPRVESICNKLGAYDMYAPS